MERKKVISQISEAASSPETMKIYEPYTIKGVTFKNRIVLPPMNPFGIQEGEDASLGDDIIAYYERRIKGNLGLLITNAFAVTRKGNILRPLCMTSPKQQESLKKLIDLCHAYDTRIFVQIAYPSKGHHRHEKIDHWTREELQEIEDQFVECARIAKDLGADGVEIHGANMFFLNLFSSPISNDRTDEFGGDLEGRLRLAANIIRRIREFADDKFLIDYRMGWNLDLKTDIETAKYLESLGIDLFHISYGIRESDRIMPKEYPPVVCYPGTTREKQIGPEDFPFNDVVYSGKKIHEALHIPVILVDEIWTIGRGEQLLQEDAGEFIALGRPFLADPDLVEKSAENPDYLGCYRCKACAWFDDYSRCPKVKQRGFA